MLIEDLNKVKSCCVVKLRVELWRKRAHYGILHLTSTDRPIKLNTKWDLPNYEPNTKCNVVLLAIYLMHSNHSIINHEWDSSTDHRRN